MVVVQCYHCSKILELDEGFRGGVCRCSQCGSLLQVPKAAAAESGARARPAAPGASVTEAGRPANPNEAAATRVETDPRSGFGSGMSGVGSGMGNRPARPDRPASPGESGAFAQSPMIPSGPRKIEKVKPVESMGGGGTGLSGMSNAASRARQMKKNKVVLWVFLTIGIVVLGLGVVITLLIVGASNNTNSTASATAPMKSGIVNIGGGAGGISPPDRSDPGDMVSSPQSQQPHRETVGFFGVPLTGRKIVISIDSGASMRDTYDWVRRGALIAASKLSDNQQIRFVVWQTPPLIVPAEGWAKGNDKARLKAFDESYGSPAGQDEVANMVASIKLGADQTIFITGKVSWRDNVEKEVAAAMKRNQKIDALYVGSSGDDPQLKELTEKSKGSYRVIDTTLLQTYYPQ